MPYGLRVPYWFGILPNPPSLARAARATLNTRLWSLQQINVAIALVVGINCAQNVFVAKQCLLAGRAMFCTESGKACDLRRKQK